MHKASGHFLITGGAGFIGSHLAEALVRLGNKPTIVDNLSTGRIENIPNGADFPGPMNAGDIPPSFLSTETVAIHLGANPRCNVSLYTPEDDAQKNYIEGVRFITRCMAAKVRRFIFVSSMSVYGRQPTLPYTEEMIPNPLDPYALHKWALEKMCLILGQASDVEVVILRPQNVFGPRQRSDLSYRNVIPRWIRKLLHGEPLPVMGSLSLERSFSPVSLVVKGILAAALIPRLSGEIFNLGSSKTRRLADIIDILEKLTSKEANFLYLPKPPTLLESAYGSPEKSERLLGLTEGENEFEISMRQLIQEIQIHSSPNEIEQILNPEILVDDFDKIYTEKQSSVSRLPT